MKTEMYIKILVKDGLPKDGSPRIYHLINPVPSKDEGQKEYEECYTIHKEQVKWVKRNCDWYFEPAELPEHLTDERK